MESTLDKKIKFKQTLERYINYRGIDIVLVLNDGTSIELDKNRQMDGDVIIKNGKDGIQARIEISEIKRADFFAA